MNSKVPSDDSNIENSIPVARSSNNSTWESATVSSLWWLTLVCLAISIGLVWWSIPETGTLVEVTFPDGHGLQSEDQVLYRGIEVGVVEDVELKEGLDSVRVDLRLNASASDLAREGTQFWIVRPELSFSRITGLETAVGHKYVSLSPGPEEAAPCYEFEGLIEQPPIDSDLPGLEFVLRGDKRHSVSPGSSVTFRGVVVGRILSVGLSQDSRFVDVRGKIFERHKRLLTPASRFWASSGFNFDFSLKEGLKFDSESIASIAQGGVSFVNIANETDSVQTGQVFRLNSEPEDEWLQAANTVSSTGIPLKGVIGINKTWRQRGIFSKDWKTSLNAIPVHFNDASPKLILPITATEFPKKAIPNSPKFEFVSQSEFVSIESPSEQIKPLAFNSSLGSIESTKLSIDECMTREDFRIPENIESVFAVRANVTDSDVTFLHYPIEKVYMRKNWELPHFEGDQDLWHGTPVLAAEDGKILGILFFQNKSWRILSIKDSFFE